MIITLVCLLMVTRFDWSYWLWSRQILPCPAAGAAGGGTAYSVGPAGGVGTVDPGANRAIILGVRSSTPGGGGSAPLGGANHAAVRGVATVVDVVPPNLGPGAEQE